MHGLKQLTKSTTRVALNRCTLTQIDHVLASFPSRVSQKGVIDVGISDQLVFCTQRILGLKTGGICKYLNFCSFKNYTTDSYKEALKQLDFPNYKTFDDVNGASPNFFQKMTAIDNTASYRNERINGNTQK